MSFGYVEIGVCARCNKPDHLFVHSSQPHDQRLYCMGCHISWHNLNEDWTVEQQLEVFPIIKDTPVCQCCGKPEFADDDGRWHFTEGLLADFTPITLHTACSDSNCTDCDNNFAIVRYRSWRMREIFNLPDNHDFMEFVQIEGIYRCRSCADVYMDDNGGSDNFHYCESCEDTVRLSDTRRWDGDRYCEGCVDANLYTCDDCGEEYWSEHYNCSYDPDEDDDNGVIHSYSYRPRPEFFGSGQYHLGFELEVEARNSSRYHGAEITQDMLGSRAYMKDDGSLNDGFEIVTHPHTLDKYQGDFNWDFLDRLKREGFRSWNTTSCGLHVHVSRTAFGTGAHPWDADNRPSREQIILKRQSHELRFMKLIYDNQRQVERIAGRSNNNYATFQDKGKLVPKLKEGNQTNGRYSAINTENDATLEVRVFKGSLRKERVLSAIEFVTASVEYTRDLKVTSKNQALSWLRFTAYVSQNLETYPNLATIMSESFATDATPDEN
jgi:hypothetical protein